MNTTLKGLSKKRIFLVAGAVSAFLLLVCLSLMLLYVRKPMKFNFDAAYFWAEKKVYVDNWLYEELPSGHDYFLFLPEKYRKDKDNESAKLPLIVVFHGSDEKYSSLRKYGRQFVTKDFQKKIYPEGAAVLVILSRINYFTDPASTSLLIQNIALRNKCIDKTNIIGYGFSQGAKFVVELACHEPRLFRAVISGSGFYDISLRELISVLPVQFYSAVSKNDKGIYEQGRRVGKLCGKWCKNSHYIEYETRGHFWVELNDKTSNGDETVTDWLIKIVN